jgi:hypothetical protein
MAGGRRLALGGAIIVLAAAASGCGGSDSSSEVGSTAAESPRAVYPEGPTREFIVPGGDNVVQMFGREATPAERKEASAVIAAWMRARAAQNWKKDCSYFSRKYLKIITDDAHRVTDGRVDTCPEALAYFGHEASGDYVNTLSGPIDSLRAGEGHGYAQYHGRDGRDWIVPMDREGEKWRVANATPIERNK